MKIQVLSDLHLEFDGPGWRRFIQGTPSKDVDVMVLAGDIMSGPEYEAALGEFARRYPRVLAVYGNHEFYDSDRETVLARGRAAMAAHPNVTVLDSEAVTVDGVRFLGTPLWFRRPDENALTKALEQGFKDFRFIQDYASWVYQENARALRFFREELRPGDVVVTHHLPARASLSPAYREYVDMNRFFLCDVEPLIRERQPRLWIHGHTHTPTDYQLWDTRVVCNPRGYSGERKDRKRGFRRWLTIALDPLDSPP